MDSPLHTGVCELAHNCCPKKKHLLMRAAVFAAMLTHGKRHRSGMITVEITSRWRVAVPLFITVVRYCALLISPFARCRQDGPDEL